MTVALAQALEVPVPSSLSQPKVMDEQTEYNPLQPDNPVSSSSPNAPVLTPSAGYPYSGAPSNTPASLTSTEEDRQLQPQLVSPLPPTQPRRSHKGLVYTLIAGVLLLLVVVSAVFVYPQLSSKNTSTTPTPTSGTVGHITFNHSPNIPNNMYNQLQIMLNNIASLPAGKTYYAWLVNNESTSPLNWELQFSNGTTHYSTTINASPPILLTNYTQFVVTLETTGSPAAVPAPLSALYYAPITPTSSPSPTYDVKQCPSSGTNPCI